MTVVLEFLVANRLGTSDPSCRRRQPRGRSWPCFVLVGVVVSRWLLGFGGEATVGRLERASRYAQRIVDGTQRSRIGKTRRRGAAHADRTKRIRKRRAVRTQRFRPNRRFSRSGGPCRPKFNGRHDGASEPRSSAIEVTDWEQANFEIEMHFLPDHQVRMTLGNNKRSLEPGKSSPSRFDGRRLKSSLPNRRRTIFHKAVRTPPPNRRKSAASSCVSKGKRRIDSRFKKKGPTPRSALCCLIASRTSQPPQRTNHPQRQLPHPSQRLTPLHNIMSERERWVVYPLLFLTLGIAIRDKMLKRVDTDAMIADRVISAAPLTLSNTLQADEVVCGRLVVRSHVVAPQ